MLSDEKVRALTGILLILTIYILCTNTCLSLIGIIYLSISCNMEYNYNYYKSKNVLDFYMIICLGILYFIEKYNYSLLLICGYLIFSLNYDTDIVGVYFKCYYTMILPNRLIFLLDNRDELYSFNFNYELFVFIMICWMTDVACYISGKLCKNPHIFNNKLGKGKTIEGIFGGILLGIIFSFFIQQFFLNKITNEFTIILPILSVTGDIIESAIKRKIQIKDFGNVFPGHGGFLDRFDSVIFSAIIISYYKH